MVNQGESTRRRDERAVPSTARFDAVTGATATQVRTVAAASGAALGTSVTVPGALHHPVVTSADGTRLLVTTVAHDRDVTHVTVVNATAEAKFGRVPVTIDLTRLGSLSLSTATTKAQTYLDKVSPRMVVSGEFTVSPGQVTTTTYGPIDLAQLQPGVVARIQLVTLYRDALAVPTSAVDMLIGRVKYDADSGTATVAPVASAADPLAVMFGGKAKTLQPNQAA